MCRCRAGLVFSDGDVISLYSYSHQCLHCNPWHFVHALLKGKSKNTSFHSTTCFCYTCFPRLFAPTSLWAVHTQRTSWLSLLPHKSAGSVFFHDVSVAWETFLFYVTLCLFRNRQSAALWKPGSVSTWINQKKKCAMVLPHIDMKKSGERKHLSCRLWYTCWYQVVLKGNISEN